MALIACPDCGRQVSDIATSCPQCGRPIAAQIVSPKIIASPIDGEPTVGDTIKDVGKAVASTAKAAWSIPIAIIVLLLPAPVIWILAAVAIEPQLGTGRAFLLAFPVTFAMEAALFFLYFRDLGRRHRP